MDWPRICTAVIPCFNEAAVIGTVVSGVRQHLPEVLVVDDGSADRTAALARSAGATVITHPANQGKGAAVRSGLDEASRRGFMWAMLLDGDGQHDPDDIPCLLLAAGAGDVDLVIGNRLENPAALPPLRRWVNRWMSRRISGRVGFHCPDSQCGFRLVRLAALGVQELQRNRFETESEMLVAMVAGGSRVRFAPVRCLPARRPSHIRPLRDGWRWFRWWWEGSGGQPSD
ncbi:MAG: glycosyltransferase family 2 protein [Verrucomicrobiae bacterium]|nr:glycosyltransferase family 2 protein [Verrucomicrobiae bacterium]MCP5521200.1 glycosyltransferase family 2 protein [Verrucomicrobiales bacterium]